MRGNKTWIGKLSGIFHGKLNGIKPVVVDLVAKTPNSVFLRFMHPHVKRGAVNQIELLGYPPDIFNWLRVHPHVEVPEVLVSKIVNIEASVTEGLRYAVSAELGREEEISEVYRIGPWYFVIAGVGYTNPITPLSPSQVRLAINRGGVDMLAKMATPEKFGELDHDSLFSYLLNLSDERLAKIWIICPDYFDVLRVFDFERWEILFTKAQKGVHE